MVTAGNSTCDLLVTLMLVVTGWDWKSATKLARLLTDMKAKKTKMRAHTSIRILDFALAALFRPRVQLNGGKMLACVFGSKIYLAQVVIFSKGSTKKVYKSLFDPV